MLYNGFKGYVDIDSTGRIGFEVCRGASRYSIKVRNVKGRVEQEIFGVLGKENMIALNGHDSELRGGVLTCKDFAERYGHELPKNATVLTFGRIGSIGPFQIGEEAEVKITDASIYWMIRNKRFVKHIRFAWVFGSNIRFDKIDPFLHADSHFYSSLFGNLHQIITHGYQEKVDKDTRSKVLDTFTRLIERIYNEFKNELVTTRGDEQVFQQLLIKYKFFLSPDALSIEGQPSLNGKELRKPDFRIVTHEAKSIYVEIEPPFYKPFDGSKASARLKGALKQVTEWKDILSHQSAETGKNSYLIIMDFSMI